MLTYRLFATLRRYTLRLIRQRCCYRQHYAMLMPLRLRCCYAATLCCCYDITYCFEPMLRQRQYYARLILPLLLRLSYYRYEITQHTFRHCCRLLIC